MAARLSGDPFPRVVGECPTSSETVRGSSFISPCDYHRVWLRVASGHLSERRGLYARTEP